MSGNKTRKAMKTKPKKRNRAAQDSTLINIRALKKRIEMWVNRQIEWESYVDSRFYEIEMKIRHIDSKTSILSVKGKRK